MRRVEHVEIDADVDVAGWQMTGRLERRVGRHDDDAVPVDHRLLHRVEGAHADLRQALGEAIFQDTRERRGVRVQAAPEVRIEIGMGIEMHDRERMAAPRMHHAAKQGEADRVVASDEQRRPAARGSFRSRRDSPKILVILARVHIAGIDPDHFVATLAEFNADAVAGRDRRFGKGEDPYSAGNGDPAIRPNPCLAPLDPPFYAVRMVPGDLATFLGLDTDAHGRVRDARGKPIPGLYAAGNDAAGFAGGTYAGAGISVGQAMTLGYLAGHDLARGPCG